ncbi:hypothetical protein [Ruminiclostridium cellulolyticum]|uniref:MacB-like periplasmic core domain-containing protein n=1 Tax=Ruminiclostridium cellulolyticum (strain ATCC 35319 / DSM 5812 / JCM 6584 / H10) TaxID=394503 RepID=B8I708_RUMCH|nr:hypothetical protein [Ruminiclostridium cellulolyticum]ACL77000.1 hypothetical protein Ccel_2681 [Ruminiclostridium cellulolyticum H10]
MKENKSIYIKLLESIIYIMIFTIIILPNTIYQSKSLQEQLIKQDTEKGFIRLKDNYNGEDNGMSIMDFFKKPDAVIKMRKLYNNISSNNNFTYYEISRQNLQFIGKYTGYRNLVNGSEESINTETDGNLYTPLKSLQLGKKASTYLNMEDKINQGKYFLEKDYYLNSNNEIPVILGDLYSGMYKIGDSFEVLYLGVKKFKCNVIGFFKKDSSFYIDHKENLDDKIIMPALIIDPRLSLKNKKFEQILYSIKNTGYIPYNTNDEYNHITMLINKIANEIDIDWGYIGKYNNVFEENPIKISLKTAKFIKILSWLIALVLTIIIYKLEKQIYKRTNFSQNKKNRVLLQTKKSIFMALHLSLLYAITCFVMSICLKNNAIYLTLIRMQKQMVIFVLFGFIAVTFMLNLYLKKNIRTE